MAKSATKETTEPELTPDQEAQIAADAEMAVNFDPTPPPEPEPPYKAPVTDMTATADDSGMYAVLVMGKKANDAGRFPVVLVQPFEFKVGDVVQTQPVEGRDDLLAVRTVNGWRHLEIGTYPWVTKAPEKS